MTEREQWRFQWPDGTWIRWNPQTQSWEKEDQGQATSSRPAEATTTTDPPVRAPVASDRPISPSATPGGWKPVAEPPTPTPPIEEPVAVRDEPAPLFEPEIEEPTDTTEVEAPRRAIVEERRPEKEVKPGPVRAAPRRSVAEVIPPNERDRPGGSLMPTIVAGAVVGIAVGLLLSAVLR